MEDRHQGIIHRSCHFVHPEHKVSDPPSLRLSHVSKRYYVLHLYWPQSEISKVNIISLAISIFHLNSLVYPALCFTEMYFECIIGKQETVH